MEELARRVAELERRVAALEAGRGAVWPPVAIAPRASSSGEAQLGLTWLNRIGAVVVIAGLALAALWAHERGHLTPPWRNVLGALAGGTLFAFGARALRSGDPARRAFGVGVAAVGAFALYLVPFVTATLDRIVDRPIAAAAAGGLTLAIGALAAYRREVVLALLAAIFGAAYALASGYGIALLPIGAIAAGAGLVCAAEALFVTGALLFGGGVALAMLPLGAGAIPFVALAVAAGIAELARPRAWRHTLAISMVIVLAAVVVAQRTAFDARLDGTQALALLLAVAALRAPSQGALDPIHARDPLRLLAYLQAHLVALDLALRAVPWGIGTSIVLVTHALALVAIGVARRHVASRVMGLSLFGCALLKAFVVDVWRADTGVRVLALLALGGGLLGGSYLYSRLERRYVRS